MRFSKRLFYALISFNNFIAYLLLGTKVLHVRAECLIDDPLGSIASKAVEYVECQAKFSFATIHFLF